MKVTKGRVVGSALALILATPALAEEWSPSKYGPNDELGAANLLSPELVLKAAKLVRRARPIRWACR